MASVGQGLSDGRSSIVSTLTITEIGRYGGKGTISRTVTTAKGSPKESARRAIETSKAKVSIGSSIALSWAAAHYILAEEASRRSGEDVAPGRTT